MRVERIAAILMSILVAATAAAAQDVQPSPSPSPAPDVTVQTPGTKKPGVIRIGIPNVKSSLKAETGTTEISEAIRTRWVSFLQGPTVELIPIDARSPQQINVEATQKECDFVLYSSVAQRAKTSLFGSLIKVTVPVLVSAGGGTAGGPNTQSTTGGVRDAAGDMATQAAALIKTSDQVILEYNLVKVGGTTSLLSRSLKAKASSDGQDIFSNLIEQAADQILSVAMKG